MKKIFALAVLASVLTLAISVPLAGFAQTANGLTIYEDVLTGKVKCADLKDSDFFAVGDYVLNQGTQAQKTALDTYIKQYKGTMSDNDFSTLMGKYFTGCAVPGADGTGLTNAPAGNNKGAFNYNGYGYWGMMSWIGSLFSIISFLIGLVVLIIVVKIVLRLVRGSKKAAGSAADILKERYVKGEITKEEYEQKKNDIQK